MRGVIRQEALVYVYSQDENELEATLTHRELSAALANGTVKLGTGVMRRYVVTPKGQALLDND